MDRIELLERIKTGFVEEHSDAKVYVLSDKLPMGVEFLVVSSSFQGMSRHKRMNYMVERTEKIFGREFYERLIIGSALTESEFLAIPNIDNQGLDVSPKKRLDQSAIGTI